MLGLFGFLHVFTLRLAQRRPKRRLKRQSSWPSRRRRRPASVTGGVVVVVVVAVVAVVAAVVVTAGFAAAVAFDVASIPALQEPRGLNAWERRWRNQRKKAAAKVGAEQHWQGRGCLSRCVSRYRRQSSASRMRELRRFLCPPQTAVGFMSVHVFFLAVCFLGRPCNASWCHR